MNGLQSTSNKLSRFDIYPHNSNSGGFSFSAADKMSNLIFIKLHRVSLESLFLDLDLVCPGVPLLCLPFY